MAFRIQRTIRIAMTVSLYLASSLGQTGPTGHWEGSADMGGDKLRIVFDIGSSDSGFAGKFSLPGVGVIDEHIARLQVEGPEIRIQLPERGGNIAFTGSLDGDQVEGTWKYRALSGGFQVRRQQLPPQTYREEAVRFQNGAVTLAGTLLLPLSNGPHPAVVFVHGSGPARRDSSAFLARRFASAGVAALIYDKRGVGESSGDYRRSTFDDLAGDALAAVELLRRRADIYNRQVGLHGTSQGGWIAPLAASRSRAVAFLILVSAPAITPARTELQSVEANVRAQGFAAEQVSAAVELTRLKIQFALTGEGWEQYSAAAERARHEKWFPLAGAPLSRDHWSFAAWRLIFGYDPVPVLERISCPTLAIFGGRDTTFRVNENLLIWQRTLAPGIPHGHVTDATFKLFPKADHSVIEFPRAGEAMWPKFADSYLDFTLDWLLRHVHLIA